MNTEEQYRKYAVDTLQMANEAKSPNERARLMAVSRGWLELAITTKML
jgi:hypothetical protein